MIDQIQDILNRTGRYVNNTRTNASIVQTLFLLSCIRFKAEVQNSFTMLSKNLCQMIDKYGLQEQYALEGIRYWADCFGKKLTYIPKPAAQNVQGKAIGAGAVQKKERTEDPVMADAAGTGRKPAKLRFSYKEQREYETIDADIEALEEKIREKDEEIALNATDFEKLNALTKEKEQLEAQLAEKMDRWVYLNELAEKISTQ